MLNLRNAVPTDCEMVFEWANDPLSRAMSNNPEPLVWESHKAWFARKLEDKDCVIYIGEDDGQPVALCRVEVVDGVGVVSVIAAVRGKGYGSDVINQGSQRALQHLPITTITASIKAENIPSIKMTEKAGYIKDGELWILTTPSLSEHTPSRE